MAYLILERVLSFLALNVPQSLRVAVALTGHLLLPYSNGVGTIFNDPGLDPYNKGTLACVSHKRPNGAIKQLIKNGRFVAHRTLPCYQMIHVCVPRNGKCSVAVVADRGPVHADMDLYKNLADDVNHNGMEEVRWKKIYLYPKEENRRRRWETNAYLKQKKAN